MTDITELATVLRLAAESEIAYREEGDTSDLWQDEASPDNVLALVEALEKAQQHIARQEQILLNQDESLSIRRGELEAAQQERESWRTSFDNERFRADKLKAHIDDIEPVRAAAEKLVRCKGRYRSELNYRALAELFGVTTPDLPPLEHENVHYADAAEMEIAALRQRIAELESRTVRLPDDEDGQACGFGKWSNSKLPATAGTMTIAYCEDAWRAAFEVFSSAAGIKVEAE
ncbi:MULTISPECIES: ead/Ea22-like family protein [Klebsiella]|uniref:ead/Ea22-like family protein n=1 Tax=Klebsiella TaxID=570 RepID=UPI002247858A|nr:ead/Ea22-like family protein [Klebsiella oxytoca]MCW9541992.1 ead/Ea22-like family protein [Klebsiella oxytoca]MCW9563612.1 ead/Ea22-like family protein [Klebsiella oxytoca]MCW9574153.1 ead/Ea22-like family protein [Klebsiella oxytoca]WBQ40116.1 ead/Ea22-like family protein [Klebsiella oxytoca]